MKIGAVFSDYDGTLSPFNASRDNALVPPLLLNTLKKISAKIPFCIITTKTIRYITGRLEFVTIVAGIGGLEIKIGNHTIIKKISRYKMESFEKMFNDILAITHGMDNIIVEEKRSVQNKMLGFTIDWRLSRDWNTYKSLMRPIVQKSIREGLYVLTYREHPFFDVYIAKPDKGKALQKLKKELKINDKILYLGDSENDNSAFEKSDISIGIVHKEVKPILNCQYLLRYEKLNVFLKELVQNNLEFDPNLFQLDNNPSFKFKNNKKKTS